jgi:putative membrane protein
MKIQSFARWASLCAALSMPLVAAADKDTSKYDTKTTDTKPTKLTDGELAVLAHVHHVDQMEIDAGKLAQKKGTTQAVKSYGQMLVKDHGQNDRDIIAFAKKRGQTIPSEKVQTDADKKDAKDAMEAMDRLKNMKGADFDREFLRMMADGHDKELAKIDTAVGQVNDTDLATMLKDMKPVLQKHADQARDLAKNNAQASLK